MSRHSASLVANRSGSTAGIVNTDEIRLQDSLTHIPEFDRLRIASLVEALDPSDSSLSARSPSSNDAPLSPSSRLPNSARRSSSSSASAASSASAVSPRKSLHKHRSGYSTDRPSKSRRRSALASPRGPPLSSDAPIAATTTTISPSALSPRGANSTHKVHRRKSKAEHGSRRSSTDDDVHLELAKTHLDELEPEAPPTARSIDPARREQARARLLKMREQSLDNALLPKLQSRFEEHDRQLEEQLVQREAEQLLAKNDRGSIFTKIELQNLKKQQTRVFGVSLTTIMARQKKAASGSQAWCSTADIPLNTTEATASSSSKSKSTPSLLAPLDRSQIRSAPNVSAAIAAHEWVWQSHADNPAGVPAIVYQSVEYIRSHGTDAQGIFRLAGTQREVQEIEQVINSGMQIVFKDLSIHSVADVLRSYLRQLPEPVVPRDSYFPHFQVANEISDHKVKLAYFAALIASLPKHNRALMKYMCYFLADIASHSEKTKMDINNLSMIFAPSLLGIPDSELDSHGAVAAPMKGPTGHLQLVSAARFLKDAQQCQKILAFILQNVHQVLVDGIRPVEVYHATPEVLPRLTMLESDLQSDQAWLSIKPGDRLFVFSRSVKRGTCNAELHNQVCLVPLRILDCMQLIHITCSAHLSPESLMATSAQLRRPLFHSRVHLRRGTGNSESLASLAEPLDLSDSANVQFTNTRSHTVSEDRSTVKVLGTPRSHGSQIRLKKRKDTPLTTKRQQLQPGEESDDATDSSDGAATPTSNTTTTTSARELATISPRNSDGVLSPRQNGWAVSSADIAISPRSNVATIGRNRGRTTSAATTTTTTAASSPPPPEQELSTSPPPPPPASSESNSTQAATTTTDADATTGTPSSDTPPPTGVPVRMLSRTISRKPSEHINTELVLPLTMESETVETESAGEQAVDR